MANKPNNESVFWARVDKNGPVPEHRPELGQCWIWTHRRNKAGYGEFQVARKHGGSHRFSYKFAHGEFDPKLDVLHKCDNPPCVRPDHLFLGSDAENMLDASAKRRHVQSKKTHCPKGHPYAGPNLGMSKHHDTKSGKGWNRYCRKCHSERQAKRYRRQREITAPRAVIPQEKK